MNRRTFLNRPLSDADLREVAPSAFAVTPWQGQSSRYTFVPTSAIIAGMRDAGFFPYNAIQSRSRIPGKADFTRHMLRFRPENVSLTQLGDTTVEAVLVNSHDGTSCYELSLGAFRLACLNGMMVAEGVVGIIHIRHTGDIIGEVVDATRNILATAPKVVDAIGTWKGINLLPAEARALAESAHGLRFEADAPAPSVEKLLQPRRSEDSGTDLWSTFNRIQENTVEGGLRTYHPTTHRRNRTRAVVGIGENVKLNRALWTLAEKMAEIKTGVTA